MRIHFPLVFFVLMLAGCQSLPVERPEAPYDTLFSARLIRIKDFQPDMAVDVIEEDPTRVQFISAVGVFRIERVLKGEMPMVRAGGPSRADQLKEAAEDRNLLSLLTLDVQDPDALIEKPWLSLAVGSATRTFDVTDRENLPQARYYLFLNTLSERPGSFQLVACRRAPDTDGRREGA